MAEFKFVGENNQFHLEDDKDRKPLENGKTYDITVKRAEAAHKEYGEIFEREES